MLRLRLFVYVVLLSGFFTLITSSYQLWFKYQGYLSAIEQNIDFIEKSYVPAITKSLYEVNSEQIKLLLDGILRLPDIGYLEIAEISGDKTYITKRGEPTTSKDITKTFELIYHHSDNRRLSLGTLMVVASFSGINQRLWENARVILFSSAIQIFLLGLCIFIVIQFLITRHLKTIAQHTEQLTMNNLDSALKLNRKEKDEEKKDELAQVVSTFNDLQHRLLKDIEARRQAEKELEKFTQRLSAHLENTPLGVIEWDLDFRVILWNQAAENIFGYTKKEAIGHTGLDLIIANDPLKNVLNVWRDLISGEGGTRSINDNITKDGRTIICDWYNTTLFDDEGNVIGVASLVQDVTSWRELEEEKTKLERHLQQSQKMEAVGTLAGGIAHDFNNMLGGILGATELLGLRLPNDSQSRKLHQTIIDSATRAADLTKQLLVFSRQSEAVFSVVNVHKIIIKTMELFKRAADKRIIINTSLKAKLSRVSGDPALLQNSFLNLLINASHSMPKGGTVWINSKNMIIDEQFCKTSIFEIKPGSYIEIEIRDEGYGIAPEHIDRIFEPFFTTKSEEKGTGLGLASVYGITQQHKGSITVFSEIGSGTSFRIMLPTSEKEESIKAKELELKRGVGHILIVDDEEVMRITAKAILEELGYTVSLAENGQEAVELYIAPNNSFDVVLLDMVMPVMNGRDCFELIKKHDQNACVILSSGFGEQEDLESMMSEGLEDFIRKPYLRASLGEKVYKAINKYQHL